MAKPAIRIFFWVLFVGAIGGLLQAKSAIIEFEEIASGVLCGGSVGFVIAILLNATSSKKQQQHD